MIETGASGVSYEKTVVASIGWLQSMTEYGQLVIDARPEGRYAAVN
jgi:hypothetical protein